MKPRTILLTTIAYKVLLRVKHGTLVAARYAKTLLWRLVMGPAEGWTTFLLLLISVMVAFWSLRIAHPTPTPGLYSIALWSVLLGLVLAKIPLRGWPLVTGGLLVGLYLSFYYLTTLSEGATALDRHADTAARLSTWWQGIASEAPSREWLPLSFSLLFASWTAGFISSWSLFRKRNMWGTLIPCGTIVIASLTTMLPREPELYLYLYLFSALLLAARLYTLQRNRNWERRGIQHFPRRSKLRAPDGLWFAVVVVLVASLLPIRATTFDSMTGAWNAATRPVQLIAFDLYRTLGGTPPTRPAEVHSFRPVQTIGGAASLRDEPAIIVTAPTAIYLTARHYDVYDHRGWQTSPTYSTSPGSRFGSGLDTGLMHTREIDVRVTTMLPIGQGEPIFIGGYPVDISVGHTIEALQSPRYHLSIVGSQPDTPGDAEGLPDDLQQAQLRLQEMSDASDHALTSRDIVSVLPPDVSLVSKDFTGGQATQVTVERHIPSPLAIVSILAADSLASGESYETSVLVSTASEGDLIAAGTDYPGWITDTYLQLPEDTPSGVANLAWELTSDAETPYEMAVAIRDYLRTLEYALDVTAPPHGADAVEYFLFELEKGYCTHFASAMTVMLRARGVPSRFVAGYVAEGLMDDSDDSATEHPVNGSHGQHRSFFANNSHAWCEVFFPEYGWIPFEPTPGYTIITGEDLAGLPSEDGGGEREIAPERGDEPGIFPGLPTDPPDDDTAHTHPAPGETQPDRRDMRQFLLPLGVATGLTALGLAFWLARRRLFGETTEPRLAYSRTGYLAALSGLGPQDNLTPNEYGSRLTTAAPQVSTSLERIVDTYVRSCYGQHGITDEDRRKVAEAWPPVRNHLIRRALRGLLPGRLR